MRPPRISSLPASDSAEATAWFPVAVVEHCDRSPCTSTNGPPPRNFSIEVRSGSCGWGRSPPMKPADEGGALGAGPDAEPAGAGDGPVPGSGRPKVETAVDPLA